ncbi:MAG: type II toxin-antitoxin system VapC family toxin [Acidobacteriota bacterium]|nr:type II toxin-antitoxin system VapC family toxin [Acidobacteriota bacterium]
MPSYFLDTSALAKLYVREPGTDKMLKLAAQADASLVILSLSRVELRAAVQRRVRSRDLSKENAQAALTAFNDHLGAIYVVQHVTEALIEKALGLIDKHNLRAYDSIQLAACLTLPMQKSDERATFTCADKHLIAAAEKEGWPVFNPAV